MNTIPSAIYRRKADNRRSAKCPPANARPIFRVSGICQLLSAAGLITVLAFGSVSEARADAGVLKRVLDSHKLRCGYINYAPYTLKNPNSNALTGISVEAMDAIGKKLDLEIEWTEEVGYGSFAEGLDAGRYDAMCSGVWQNSTRGKKVFFTLPLLFNPIRVWVRNDETRYKSLADLNAPNVRLAVQDGSIGDVIAQTNFPRAQRVSIPQLNQWTDNLLNITSKKADAVFSEPSVITPFLEKNPGSLKLLPTPRPLRVFGVAIPIKMGETEFKSMLDSAIIEILSDGTMEEILAKYEKAPGELLRVAAPYEEPKN
jgi:polar amino acid transport system substrate-binding protein